MASIDQFGCLAYLEYGEVTNHSVPRCKSHCSFIVQSDYKVGTARMASKATGQKDLTNTAVSKSRLLEAVEKIK